MQLEQVKALSPFKRLVYWITEREAIRIKKADGRSKPWTDDPILQNYRFCNVRRMDDKVSKWLYTNWYSKHYSHKNAVVACVLARHLNRIEALRVARFPVVWNPDRMLARLVAYREGGGKCFNAAYIIAPRVGFSKDKLHGVILETVQQFVDKPPDLNTDRMQDCVECLQEYAGIGSFMAGQIVADLRWSVDGGWRDRKIWAPMGPGSQRGMNRLRNRSVETPIKPDQFATELGSMMLEIKPRLKQLGLKVTGRLEAIDYQSCLCEYDKYIRCLFEEGRPKQRYDGKEKS